MARKKKTRTVEDIIDDIRELHEKEEDLLKQGGGYTTIPTKNVLSIKKIKI